ncbi:MucBP domain-containing protein [Lactococcus paracarnosus]|uniref:MucBP domain-containing protein n=2 Tax=Pseudolactococcus paracarnosus TaxID=2749962 RepID=A0A7L4WFG0_9LACT|nr:MucBP domain-containing protein [Lactococcus paracarnosus]QDJ27852.1 hypothetical protein BHS01_04610 [Lactococcus paracarnosus]SPC35791.1 hypothetical protein LPICM02_220044 [Lactococcus piscium]
MITKFCKYIIYGLLILILIPIMPLNNIIYAQARGDTSSGITFKANATEFAKGGAYTMNLHLLNQDGDTIPTGSKITLSIPSDAVNYDALDVSDSNLTQLFDITVDKAAGQIIFTLKKDIVGQVDVNGNISGTIIGDEGKTYDVGSTFTSPDGSTKTIDNQSPQIKVIKEDPNPPAYGFINSFWGMGPNDPATFIGKNVPDIDNFATGNFSRTTDEFSNFTQINAAGNGYVLPDSQFYQYYFTVIAPDNVTEPIIDENSIVVTDETTGAIVDPSAYTIDRTTGKNQLSVSLKSPRNSNGAINGADQFRIAVKTHVLDSSIVYHSISTVYVKYDTGGQVKEYQFDLNDQFTQDGHSDMFPNMTVEDKTYHAGELTEENIKAKLLENITAQDTTDGDMAKDIQVDYGDLLDKANTIGNYVDQVTYRVVNSTGHVTHKTITVHITDKADGGVVTVKYVDTDNKPIAGVDTETLNGKVGDPYASKEKTIPGYQLIKTPDNAKGKFTDQAEEVVYQYQGALLFVDAPGTLDFGTHELSPKDETYLLENKDKDILVQDNRSLDANWEMRATLTKELTEKKTGKTLPNVLYYDNDDNQSSQMALNDPVVIKDVKTKSHDQINLSSNWIKDKKGLKLKVKTGTANIGSYSGDIRWDLYDTVAND